MSKEKTDETVSKIMEITKDSYPSFLFICTGKEDGFALMASKETKDHARLMAQITDAMLNSPELYEMMTAVMNRVNELKKVN